MVGNLIVNGILAGILYGAFYWSPWASLVLASLSSVAFSYNFLFDREFLERIAQQQSDQLSVILGAGISYVAVVVSVVVLVL